MQLNYTSMKRVVFNICLLALLLLENSFAQAQQKNIVINEELAANAEMLKVKMGTAWMGKIYKFKFGDYNVVKSKMGWTVTTSSSNLLNTKTESKTENKFSFILSNNTSDSAIVNSLSDVIVKELHALNLFTSEHYEFYIGSEELLMNAQIFSSFITTSSNRNEIWVLRIEQTEGSEADNKYEGVIGNGVRIINIIPVSSNQYGNDSRIFPALGYEFKENNESLCAVQYYGGGALGSNKNIVWIKSELDPRMKLILAAAMTSLMQLKAP